MNFFKKRYKKIKEDAVRFASTKNVPPQAYSFFNVFLWVMIASSTLSIFTLSLIGMVELPDSILTTVGLNLIIPAWGMILFFGLGKYFFYAKILEVHYMQKALSYLINKLDIIWWKKYKRHSPLTESIFKIQQKGEKIGKKLSKPQKRVLMIALLIIIGGFYGYTKYPILEDMITGIDESIKHEQVKEKNLGKIFDGLNGRLESHT